MQQRRRRRVCIGTREESRWAPPRIYIDESATRCSYGLRELSRLSSPTTVLSSRALLSLSTHTYIPTTWSAITLPRSFVRLVHLPAHSSSSPIYPFPLFFILLASIASSFPTHNRCAPWAFVSFSLLVSLTLSQSRALHARILIHSFVSSRSSLFIHTPRDAREVLPSLVCSS